MRAATRLRALIGLLALSTGGSLVAAPSAFGDLLSPGSGASPNANHVNTLYMVTLYIAAVIFVGVWGTLLYSLIRFRRRRGAVATQFHGNTRLEIGWTLGAALVLLVLAVLTFVKLNSITTPANSSNGVELASATQTLPPNGRALRIKVNGQQFVWRFTYPGADNPDGIGAPYSYETLVVPTDTTVLLDVVSQDVVHSWWVPALGGKVQAVPGYHNYTWFELSRPGIYRGQCAEICGRGHARMIATVHAIPPAQFEAWLARQKRLIAQANAAATAARKQFSPVPPGSGQVNP